MDGHIQNIRIEDETDVWCIIDADGKIERIDWNEISRLAKQFINKERRDNNTIMALLAHAIREYMLDKLEENDGEEV